MSNIEKYLNKLVEDKTTLANNLVEKGVEASSEETFTELVPKIKDIQAAKPVTKGFIVNEWNDDGYPTNISIVGMTEIPQYYFCTFNSSQYKNGLVKYLKSVNLPDGLTKINSAAFQFSSITTLQIPETVTYIDSSCFDNCSLLESVNLPNGITIIQAYLFNKCSKLHLSKIPDGVTDIGDNAFNGCALVDFKEIPEGVTIIKYQAFYGCSGLTELTFKGDVTQFRSKPFYNTSKLTKIIMPNITSVPSIYSDTFSSTAISNKTGYVYVPDALVEDFKVETNWSTYAAQIKPISELPTE